MWEIYYNNKIIFAPSKEEAYGICKATISHFSFENRRDEVDCYNELKYSYQESPFDFGVDIGVFKIWAKHIIKS